MDVTVHSKDGVSVVHTTRKHPFWDVTTRAWTDADHLRAGDELMSAAGVPVTVTRTRVIPGAADMWDLTVDGLHDFYILTAPGTTGSGPAVLRSADTILVHNCGENTYHPRIRARGVEDPAYHNFPYSFDEHILNSEPTIQEDGSELYRLPGSVNGREGAYEIARNPETRLIFHRMFRP